MNTKNKRQPIATADDNRFCVYFFRNRTPYALLIRVLQWLLLGVPLSEPDHVIYSIGDTSYEITQEGVAVGQANPDALYRLAFDTKVFSLSGTQVTQLRAFFAFAREADLRFSPSECFWYTLRLLTSFCRFDHVPELGFGEVARAQPWLFIYNPPFTCTAPLWVFGSVPPVWNAFAAGACYQFLYDSLEVIRKPKEDTSESE